MTALILLNGIPAAGKSTLARAWVERHAVRLPLALDIDVLRAMLGGWAAAPAEAGGATRLMALAAAFEHLASGRDVIVPQYLRRVGFVDDLARVAADTGAAFVEAAIDADPAAAASRFDARAQSAASGRGPLLHGDLGGDEMPDVAAELERFLATRGALARIPAIGADGDADAALDALDAAVARAGG